MYVHRCTATWSLLVLHSKEGKKNVNDIVYALPTGLPIDNKLEPIKMQEYVINAWSAFAALVTEIKSYWPSKTYTC